MTNRVRLTAQAAARFPDLANRAGTVLTTSEGWHRVLWEGVGYAWVKAEDVEAVPSRQDAATGPRGVQIPAGPDSQPANATGTPEATP